MLFIKVMSYSINPNSMTLQIYSYVYSIPDKHVYG